MEMLSRILISFFIYYSPFTKKQHNEHKRTVPGLTHSLCAFYADPVFSSIGENKARSAAVASDKNTHSSSLPSSVCNSIIAILHPTVNQKMVLYSMFTKAATPERISKQMRLFLL
jgi:hypothetical protein